jgi:hypothetical protein
MGRTPAKAIFSIWLQSIVSATPVSIVLLEAFVCVPADFVPTATEEELGLKPPSIAFLAP